MKLYDCIIIWAGPAGIWIALKLAELWISYLILEKDSIWASFKKWNSQTRFITPSFTGNAFGHVDLNSIDYDTSPGFFHMKEHLSGKEYAEYLEAVVKNYKVHVQENEKVLSVEKKNNDFVVHSETNSFMARYIISAVGEFSFPSSGSIVGYKNTVHYSQLQNYESYNDEIWPIPIIWGYESSIDAAYNLYKKWKEVHIFSPHTINELHTSDPSKILSPYTSEKFSEMEDSPRVMIHTAVIREIKKENETYTLITDTGEKHSFWSRPILGTGFVNGLSYLGGFASSRDDGLPLLNEYDELEKTSGIFVVGPQVRQDDLIFCFIFKFRLRFWVIALEIAKRLKKEGIKKKKREWERQGFFLDDLSCCGDECSC